MDDDLRRIQSVADYQFGRGVGERLFPPDVTIEYSKRTGRIRYVYLDGRRLATMRPLDGMFSLSIAGARRVVGKSGFLNCLVTVRNDVSKFIAEGGDVFALHVIKACDEIRATTEVIVVNEDGRLLAVGRAVLSAGEMQAFKSGVAVKVRRGSNKES